MFSNFNLLVNYFQDPILKYFSVDWFNFYAQFSLTFSIASIQIHAFHSGCKFMGNHGI